MTDHRLWKSVWIGAASAVVAFFATYSLVPFLDEANLMLLLAAVAFSCWVADWRAGAVSALCGLVGVALLLPPVFTLTINSGADVARMGEFAFACLCVCAVGYIGDRRAQKLRSVEKRTEMSEGWIESAQKEVALWTWELNLKDSRLSWRNPYGELSSQEFRSYQVWVQGVHPDDRKRFEDEMKAARRTGAFHCKYRAYTLRGLHHLTSRGIVLQQSEGDPRVLVGITVDLDCEEPPKPSIEHGRMDGSQLVLALIAINDLIAEVAEGRSLSAEAREKLAQAREHIAKLLITDTARSFSD